MCSCGKVHLLPDVIRCPHCHKDLTNHTDEYARLHTRNCAGKLNPYQYSDRGPGRPPKKIVSAILEQRSFHKTCHNCGKLHCTGCDDGTCEDWEPQTIKRCPVCGRCPLYVEKCGTCAIICDECNLKMLDEDKFALITRWNKM